MLGVQPKRAREVPHTRPWKSYSVQLHKPVLRVYAKKHRTRPLQLMIDSSTEANPQAYAAMTILLQTHRPSNLDNMRQSNKGDGRTSTTLLDAARCATMPSLDIALDGCCESIFVLKQRRRPVPSDARCKARPDVAVDRLQL